MRLEPGEHISTAVPVFHAISCVEVAYLIHNIPVSTRPNTSSQKNYDDVSLLILHLIIFRSICIRAVYVVQESSPSL
jgi:hypothetical protein